MVKSYKTNLLNWLKTKFYTEEEVDSKLAGKSDTGHNHDSVYYTESEMDTKLKTKSDTGHVHDDRYYTESEVDSKLNTKAGTGTATSSSNGLMSSSDKSKLDGIASGATKVTVDTALSSSSTNPVQNKVINTALSGKASSSHTHDDRYYTESEMDTKLNTKAGTSVASTSANGLMSSADKSKLDGIASGATKTTIDTALSSSSTNPVQNKVIEAKLTTLNNTLTTLSNAYLKNSLLIKVGRWSDSAGEDGTKIEVNSGGDGIYAKLYCDSSSYNRSGRTVAFLINGLTYERDTDSNGKTGKLQINLAEGAYLLTVFVKGEDGINPTFVSKRIIAV